MTTGKRSLAAVAETLARIPFYGNTVGLTANLRPIGARAAISERNPVYKAVLFDLDGTMTDFHACETHALQEAFRQAGFFADSTASWAKIWRTYAPISASFWTRRVEDGLSKSQFIEHTSPTPWLH